MQLAICVQSIRAGVRQDWSNEGSKIVSVTIPNEEMSPNDLLIRFVNFPYTIPSKSMVYSTIRNNRGLIGMNPI
ncbi:hypothetical protein HZS_5732 [Henneguya salminicola]|nr:hypothetical protein HZS_5732 [Henneguya salminicola]